MGRKKDTSAPPTTEPTSPTATESPSNGEAKKRPVVSFKCSTDRTTYIEVAVWENEITPADGEPYKQYVTTAQRSYKSGDDWKTQERPGFRAHDLPVLSYLLQKAHQWALDKRVIEDIPF